MAHWAQLIITGSILALVASSGCTGNQEPARPSAGESSLATEAEAPIPASPSPYDALPEPVRRIADKPFTGDLDAMVKRRAIRVGVTFNRTHYFIDQGQERGMTYES